MLINKSDLAPPDKLTEATAWIHREYPDKEIIPVSTRPARTSK
jgi:G3E family GTPase